MLPRTVLSSRLALRSRALSNAPTRITILYCASCGYGPHARRLADELRACDGAEVALDGSGAPGAYEVSAVATGGGSRSLWSKLTTGEPSTPEAHLALGSLLRRELRCLLHASSRR